MIVKLLTEHHLEFLSLKGGCRAWSKSTHVKMSHCWKSHVVAHIVILQAEAPVAQLYIETGIWGTLWHPVAQALQVMNPETEMPIHDCIYLILLFCRLKLLWPSYI